MERYWPHRMLRFVSDLVVRPHSWYRRSLKRSTFLPANLIDLSVVVTSVLEQQKEGKTLTFAVHVPTSGFLTL